MHMWNHVSRFVNHQEIGVWWLNLTDPPTDKTVIHQIHINHHTSNFHWQQVKKYHGKLTSIKQKTLIRLLICISRSTKSAATLGNNRWVKNYWINSCSELTLKSNNCCISGLKHTGKQKHKKKSCGYEVMSHYYAPSKHTAFSLLVRVLICSL